jgi:hypothetical protein
MAGEGNLGDAEYRNPLYAQNLVVGSGTILKRAFMRENSFFNVLKKLSTIVLS